jgi:omega-6 fatty acid desaturase (delta-12 desaturase)
LALPLWIVYAIVTGTVATGVWVVAHECGHGAFSDNKLLQDAVGYAFHTILLVPYFSWQRSHKVHHSRTNHLSEGETHVPSTNLDAAGKASLESRHSWGEDTFGFVNVFQHLVFGWPAYLLAGISGGPKRGLTNHFLGFSTGEVALFPTPAIKAKVLASDVGVAIFLYFLYKWYLVEGFTTVFATYMGPYFVVNAWLVGYTWLQHTDVDIPHYDTDEWTWAKGALLTVDRPYPAIVDALHHRIGTTHVAHHICSSIPHYNAAEASEAIKKAFPEHYLYDPTPIHKALWRVSCECVAVRKEGDMWVYTNKLQRPKAKKL